MAQERIGVWLIGALGGVSTTAVVGLAGLQKKLAPETGLVSALPRFQGLGLADWPQFVIGGHEIRESTFAAEARQLYEQSRVFDPKLLKEIAPVLEGFDKNLRPGTLINVGRTIESFATEPVRKTSGERPAVAIERISADIAEFRQQQKLDSVIVVNVASTEPPLSHAAQQASWRELSDVIE